MLMAIPHVAERIGLQLETTCRTCCAILPSESLMYLFKNQTATEQNAIQEIRDEAILFNLSITKDDDLPQQICSNCASTFIRIAQFRKNCQEAQNRLAIYFRAPLSQLSRIIKSEHFDDTDYYRNTCSPDRNKTDAIQEPEELDCTAVSNNECSENRLNNNFKTEVSIEEEAYIAYEPGDHFCTNCDKSFESYQELTIHFENCRSVEPKYNQSTQLPSNFDFDSDQDRTTPLGSHINSYECNLCSRSFNCPRSLKLHFDRIHERSEHQCLICSKKFENEYKFKYHLRSHDPTKLFHCDICGKSFMAVHHLRAHDRIHKDLRPFSCDLCGKSYREKGNLDTHMRKHSGERPYACNICGKDFAIRTSYVLHMRRHEFGLNRTDDDDRGSTLASEIGSKLSSYPYTCTICSQGFNSSYILATHMKTHFEDRQYDCKECGKAFKLAAYLKSHMDLVHLKVKRFACDSCDKQFTFSNELKSHQTVHSDGKPFECNTCGKCFKRKSGYVAHYRTHTGDIYICEICGKSCKSHSRLTDHLMTHTDEERQQIQKQIEKVVFQSLCADNKN